MLPETAALPRPGAAASQAGVTIAPIMDPAEARAGLIRVLQHAYSGEKAAAYAYRGHWHSVADPEEAARIRQIEAEEWHHRVLVGGLLRELGAGPSRVREIRTAIIGRTLGALCHLSGWFIPMYAAGKLESDELQIRVARIPVQLFQNFIQSPRAAGRRWLILAMEHQWQNADRAENGEY